MRRVRLGRLVIGTQGGALTWVIAAVLLSAGSAAVAQDEATATEAAAAGPLQEVTVTATRRAESLSKVPISVTAEMSMRMAFFIVCWISLKSNPSPWRRGQVTIA